MAYGIIPPPERIPDAIILGLVGIGCLYIAMKIFMKWVEKQ